MTKQLTYKVRLKMLGACCILLVVAAWRLSISKTLNEIRQSAKLDSAISEGRSAPVEIQKINASMNILEKELFVASSSDSDATKKILDIVTNYCNDKNVSLVHFSKPVKSLKNNLEITTDNFEVEGAFKDLLNLVYLLEQKERTGKLVSVKFYSLRDIQSKKTKLRTVIYLQTFKKKTL